MDNNANQNSRRETFAQSNRLVGLGYVLASALIFSSAGLFVRAVDTDSWTIIFWRGLFAALFTLAYIVWRKKTQPEISRMGKSGVAAAAIGACGTIAFIPAFQHTTIANVSLIYAAAPFVSAVIIWIWMREKPTAAVALASLAAFAGVAMIFNGSVNTLNLRGDFMALWMTLMMAIYVCIYRRYPHTPAAGPAMLMSLFLLPVGIIMSNPLAATFEDIIVMGSFGLVFAVASVTLAEGARRLPASETSLISALETPLAPIWAFLLLAELPGTWTLIGGAVIFVAVLASQWHDNRRARLVEGQAA
ncbi:MAG: DMT family transporter [Pseudomonadota bacterium]